MRVTGWILLLIGATLLIWGLNTDVTIESGGDRIVNFDLVAMTLRHVMAGGFIAVIGAIFIVGHRPRPEVDQPSAS